MSEKKLIALTFDDGPNTTTTIKVLDILEKYKITASFFLIGNLITEETIPVIEREIALGCEINNHSLTHSFMDKMEAEDIKKEICVTSEKIRMITGEEPKFFRPPYIAVNDTMYQSIDMPFICGQGAEDWVPEVSAEERAEKVLSQTTDGSIILLHDFEGNENTVKALELIIPELQKRGYTFVTVSQLFAEKEIKIQPYPGKLYSVAQKE